MFEARLRLVFAFERIGRGGLERREVQRGRREPAIGHTMLKLVVDAFAVHIGADNCTVPKVLLVK